jgi:glycosyltransferase involved in cell wall biosynthesis
MVKITILIPTRNEYGTLQELTSRINRVMSLKYKSDWELLLVDDSSTDKSVEKIKDLQKKYKNLRLLRHDKCKGQTGCFQTGFQNAKGKIIVTMDGDLQVLPEDIPKFLDKMELGYDLVNGIRENRQHPFWMKLASRIYNIFMLLFFNSPVFDAASNFTAIKSDFVKGIKLVDNDHRYIVPIVMQRGAKRIGEVIVVHKGRKSGKSKYTALPKYIKGFFEIFMAWLRIKRNTYRKKL